MPQVIDIPGVGPVEFPDSMTESDITAAARRLHADALVAGRSDGPAMRPAPARGVLQRAVDALPSLPSHGPLGVLSGAAKGAVSTIAGLGQLARDYIPGVAALDAVVQPARVDVTTRTPEERLGRTAEQIAEFAVPGGAAARVTKALTGVPGVLARVGSQAGVAGAVAAAQDGDISAATTPAVVAGAIPLAAPVGRRLVQWGASAIPKTVRRGEQVDDLVEAVLTEDIALGRMGAARARRGLDKAGSELKAKIDDAAHRTATTGESVRVPQVNASDLERHLPALRAEIASGALGQQEPALRTIDRLTAAMRARSGGGGGTNFPFQPANKLDIADVQALKRAEQTIANNLYRAQVAGQVIPASAQTRAKFAKQVAQAAREIIEEHVPDAASLNAQMQRLGRIKEASDYLTNRNPFGGGLFSTLTRLVAGPSPSTLTGRLLANHVAPRGAVAGGLAAQIAADTGMDPALVEAALRSEGVEP